MSGPVYGVVRLLDEDPEGWRVFEDTLYHPLGFRIESDSGGPYSVNGRALGWWRRFVLRRALYRREAALVDAFLAKKAATRLAAESAEVDRLLAG